MTGVDTLTVSLGSRSYEIQIGEGLIDTAGARIGPVLAGKGAVIVTDETVAALHLERLRQALADQGLDSPAVILPAGESTKDFRHLERLCEQLLGGGIERRSTLIAFGGGVIGDLAGFAAAILLRGIDFVQIPTTLLAQVDSSVGGKTGINTTQGKNLIGAFHQPRLVLADIGVLSTLPRRQLLAGYAEVLKYGLIGDAGFFAWLEENGSRVVGGDPDATRHAVSTACAAKAEVVAADEREAGRRALLNFGHTFGHALEAEAGFGAELLHGEAVAIGMAMAFELSARLGHCPAEDGSRVCRHMADIGLPTDLSKLSGRAWEPEALLAHMAKDKKVENGRLTFVLTRGVGKAFVTQDVDAEAVLSLLSQAAAA